ncbi:MAG: FAD-dependent oxidoreductase [Actinomycetota bacterium]
MGSLDENNPSLWVATGESRIYPELQSDLAVDVVVVGAGITGLTTALLLARAGASVAVVEADRIASGTTGYTTAKLSALHGLTYRSIAEDHGEQAAKSYATAQQEALSWVAGLIDSEGIECDFARRSAFTYTTDPARMDEIQAEVSAGQAAGLNLQSVAGTELPFPVSAAVQLDDQAQFHPRSYCAALADLARQAGAQIFEMSRALEVGSGEVCTARAKVQARHVVQATQLPVHDPAGFFARTSPTRSYCVALAVAELPFEGMYLGVDTPGRSLRTHTEDGRHFLLVGGEGHKVGQDRFTGQRYQALERWAAEHFGNHPVAYRWSAQDYTSVDGLPFVGPLAGTDRRWTATGFKKWGMTNGTAAGMILCDLIQGRPNDLAHTFDTDRVKPGVSATRLIKENLNVASHFISDHLERLTARHLQDLAPGSGDVVRVGGKSVAAFRDDQGKVHAVSPVCSHLKCVVGFNEAERSWDCPCHGSRFSIDGKVLQGPAVQDLEVVELAPEAVR